MEFRFYDEVNIQIGKVTVKGELIIPSDAKAIIIFSHGSGSSRFSKRNRQVASWLHKKNLGTLLFDLLREEEDRNYQTRFDIDLLTKRLAGATEWLEKLPSAKGCFIGYFGASTGAASALRAASFMPNIGAVVSRGGRPDLAKDALSNVKAPTLLIVGGLDHDVLLLNREAFSELTCEKKLEIVEGASHLFEEPGKMEVVSELAANWFKNHLKPVAAFI
jgi:putative phosphoribosyl transferase